MEVQSVPRHGQLGTTACQLVELLKSGKPGDTISDDTLSRACGRDTSPGGKAYPNLNTAIRYCEANFGVIWQRVPKSGMLKVLDAAETTEVGASGVKAISRKSKRVNRQLATVDTSELSDDQKSRLYAMRSQVGMFELFADSKTTKQLADKQVHATPDVKKLMELFE